MAPVAPGHDGAQVGRESVLRQLGGTGLDHVAIGDHISFRGGFGADGLIEASLLLGAFPSLRVHLGVYLLPLRNPVLVARQLATIADFAPGRLHFGVGIGGEDPHESRIVGVDPATRGRRADESLLVLRQLLTGQSVTHSGEFFSFDDALITPAPTPPIPIVVGGRSDAALRRTAKFGDGWLAIWVSASRVAHATAEIDQLAAEAGRDVAGWDHGLLVWCGFGPTSDHATKELATAMEAVYQVPYANFQKYSPAGTPRDVAAFLAPYAEAGVSHVNLIAVASEYHRAIEGAEEVRERLGGVSDGTRSNNSRGGA